LNNYAEKLTCPVLYQWADKDIYVTKTEAETLFNHISSKQKKMVVYENAIHGSLVQQNITKWRIEIEGFLADK
jgi:pimeloyl-ACP methyl ester carboxylesterase